MARPPRKTQDESDRGVTPEESALWESVMRETAPMPDSKRTRRAQPDEAKPAKAAPRPEPAEPKKPLRTKTAVPPAAAPAAPPAAPMKPPPLFERSAKLPAGRRASIAGLDKRNAQRLRRGQMTIDATLDLHGMTREAAHGALIGFVRSGADRGHRCVLVITGKGARRADDDAGIMPDRSTGILRSEVPRWLGEANVKTFVVAWTPATAKHGGSGALYVLLRRKRDGA